MTYFNEENTVEQMFINAAGKLLMQQVNAAGYMWNHNLFLDFLTKYLLFNG